jgi:hypothetical protein
MSIPNLIYKIKSKTNIDKITFVYLFVIVGVGISSFGLGRISIQDNFNVKNNISTVSSQDISVIIQDKNNVNSPIIQTQQVEKRYVASKNGKMYYSIGCSGANRIKSENEVWFSTKIDAEKSGYALSSTCK